MTSEKQKEFRVKLFEFAYSNDKDEEKQIKESIEKIEAYKNQALDFRNIKGFEGLYLINRFGDVFGTKKAKYLKSHNTGHYLSVKLCKNNMMSNHYLHRLLAEAFIPKIKGKVNVNHIDGNKLNNDLSNLEWVTASENHLHAFKIGLRDNTGENSPFAKLNELDIKNIFRMYYVEGHSRNIIAEKYKISKVYVNKILRGDTWGHLNLKDIYSTYKKPTYVGQSKS